MSILSTIQEKQPLVLNLANSVTQQRVADVVSFVGGSPLMTTSIKELEELLSISSSLVLNTGTISEHDLELYIAAGKLANQMNKPIVLDPVAVMMPYRASAASRLMAEVEFTVIRGNAAEIAWFAQKVVASKGIDSLETEVATDKALIAAQATGAVIVQTGKVDVITDGERVLVNETDSPLFKINVGTGDMLSALIATFIAVSEQSLEAAFEAVQTFGQAGEAAAEIVKGQPGNFIPSLLDCLYQEAQQSREKI